MAFESFKEQKGVLSELLDHQNEKISKKKSLKEILTTYFRNKKIDKQTIEKIKDELLQIKKNVDKSNLPPESLIDIQEKIAKAYYSLKEKE